MIMFLIFSNLRTMSNSMNNNEIDFTKLFKGLDKLIKIYERRVKNKSLSLDPNMQLMSRSQKEHAIRNQTKRAIDIETLYYLKQLKSKRDDV